MMNNLRCRSGWKRMVGLCAGIAVAALIAGCQTPGGDTSKASAEVCPVCGKAPYEVAVEDVDYAKCVCPECGEVTTLSQEGAEAAMHYLGTAPGTPVAVCHHCKSVIAACPKCRAKE